MCEPISVLEDESSSRFLLTQDTSKNSVLHLPKLASNIIRTRFVVVLVLRVGISSDSFPVSYTLGARESSFLLLLDSPSRGVPKVTSVVGTMKTPPSTCKGRYAVDQVLETESV